ncbi:MAG: hypothetical protein V1811_02125 [Candidatus Micrarchaeota archaeon]
MVNVNLGAPYENAIQEIISKGYAGTQTEAIRQAILAYKRDLDEEEELRLVHKAVETQMQKIKAGKAKTHSFKKVMKEAGLE